jgi:hypothetical protein
MRIAAAASVAALAIAAASPARAGDGERAVSLGLGYASYATPNEDGDETLSPTAGAALAASYERGFGADTWWRADLIVGGYLGGGTAGSALATVGLTYRVDVLKYVPYVEAGIGALVRAGGPFDTGVEPALRIGGGIDWLRSRERSYGLAVAMTSFASDTTTVTVSLRSTWRWGYF